MTTHADAKRRTITDPVVMFDSMWEAANSLRGALIWLADHASSSEEEERWYSECIAVSRDREKVSATDMDAQHEAMLAFRARERELEHLIDV